MSIKARGRPTKYHPEIGEKIAATMAEGLSLEAAAAACGIGPRTIFTWQKTFDDFRQAVEVGRSQALLFWERRAISLSRGEPGNAALVTLALKNRSRSAYGWRDVQAIEHSGPYDGQIEVQHTLKIDHLNDDDLLVLEKALVGLKLTL
jgi:hypothetical protein